jgi:hypothetical protein
MRSGTSGAVDPRDVPRLPLGSAPDAYQVVRPRTAPVVVKQFTDLLPVVSRNTATSGTATPKVGRVSISSTGSDDKDDMNEGRSVVADDGIDDAFAAFCVSHGYSSMPPRGAVPGVLPVAPAAPRAVAAVTANQRRIGPRSALSACGVASSLSAQRPRPPLKRPDHSPRRSQSSYEHARLPFQSDVAGTPRGTVELRPPSSGRTLLALRMTETYRTQLQLHRTVVTWRRHGIDKQHEQRTRSVSIRVKAACVAMRLHSDALVSPRVAPK